MHGEVLGAGETGEGDPVHGPRLAVVEQSDNQTIVADRHARERAERDPVLLHRADAVVVAEAAHPRGVARVAQRQLNTAVLGPAGRIGPVYAAGMRGGARAGSVLVERSEERRGGNEWCSTC